MSASTSILPVCTPKYLFILSAILFFHCVTWFTWKWLVHEIKSDLQKQWLLLWLTGKSTISTQHTLPVCVLLPLREGKGGDVMDRSADVVHLGPMGNKVDN